MYSRVFRQANIKFLCIIKMKVVAQLILCLRKKLNFAETVYGGGLDAGCLIPFNKSKRMFLDLSLGYNFYPFPKNIPLEFTEGYVHYLANDVMPTDDFLFKDHFVGKTRWMEPYTGAGRKWLITITYGFVI